MSRVVRHLLVAACVVAAVLAFSGPAVAADQGAGARFHVVTSLGPVLSTGSCPGEFDLPLSSAGTVLGTQVGNGTWTDNECLSLDFSNGVRFITHGQAVLTAADGAQLLVAYDTTSGLPVNQVLYESGTFTITGGTGRFDGSTGGGTISAAVNVFTGVASDTLDGTILLGTQD
jgi:hypothetical protein